MSILAMNPKIFGSSKVTIATDRHWAVGQGGFGCSRRQKNKDVSNWRDTILDIFEIEKRTIKPTVIEIAVTTVMASHVYRFMGRYYLQKEGAPIG